MARILIFGAGGRAGQRIVAEASSRGRQVTAVVRDPSRYAGPTGAAVTVVAGDVTSVESVAALAPGHDAAVNAAARLDVGPEEFYVAATRALLDGLGRADVGRLVAVGIGSVLEVSPGTPLYDTPGFPEPGRAFSLGHAAELALLRSADTSIDWVVLAPPPTLLDQEAARSGRYRFGGNQVLPAAEGSAPLSYADLAVAIVDEIDTPSRHRALVAVAPEHP